MDRQEKTLKVIETYDITGGDVEEAVKILEKNCIKITPEFIIRTWENEGLDGIVLPRPKINPIDLRKQEILRAYHVYGGSSLNASRGLKVSKYFVEKYWRENELI